MSVLQNFGVHEDLREKDPVHSLTKLKAPYASLKIECFYQRMFLNVANVLKAKLRALQVWMEVFDW